jgi:hypothetical protein
MPIDLDDIVEIAADTALEVATTDRNGKPKWGWIVATLVVAGLLAFWLY